MQINELIGNIGFCVAGWENGEIELLVLDLVQVNQLSHSVSEGVGSFDQSFDNGTAVSRIS